MGCFKQFPSHDVVKCTWGGGVTFFIFLVWVSCKENLFFFFFLQNVTNYTEKLLYNEANLPFGSRVCIFATELVMIACQ